MISRQSRVGGQRGFTLVELIATIAVIGIISMVATPLFMTFLRASETRGASREVAALLHQARELAIATNSSYRVEVDTAGNRLRFVDASTSAPWIGPGTDDQGYRKLENQTRFTNVTANPTFNPLGSAGGGTITVQNAQGTSSLNVVVGSSGRIRIE
jgi:prepilin-type N-terminal cleavage/methylation domain-containing protein